MTVIGLAVSDCRAIFFHRAKYVRSDGDMLADKMKAAGNDVTHKLYAGVTHEFFGMDAVVAQAKEAQDFAVSQLQKGFSAPAGTVGNATSGQQAADVLNGSGSRLRVSRSMPLTRRPSIMAQQHLVVGFHHLIAFTRGVFHAFDIEKLNFSPGVFD